MHDMKVIRTLPLLAFVSWAAFTVVALPQQSGCVKLPFTLEITANGGPYDWDFAGTVEKAVKSGFPVEIAVRKTPI
jgi:hypothetical protein